jgi:hypothetical protein
MAGISTTGILFVLHPLPGNPVFRVGIIDAPGNLREHPVPLHPQGDEKSRQLVLLLRRQGFQFMLQGTEIHGDNIAVRSKSGKGGFLRVEKQLHHPADGGLGVSAFPEILQRGHERVVGRLRAAIGGEVARHLAVAAAFGGHPVEMVR